MPFRATCATQQRIVRIETIVSHCSKRPLLFYIPWFCNLLLIYLFTYLSFSTRFSCSSDEKTAFWHSSGECQFSNEKVKGQGHRTSKPQKIGVVLYGWQVKRRRIRRRLQTSPTPLLGLIYCRRQTLRSWMDGRISCQQSAATFFVVSSCVYNQPKLINHLSCFHLSTRVQFDLKSDL